LYEPVKTGAYRTISVKDGVLRVGTGNGQALKAITPDRFVPASSPGAGELYFPAPTAGAPRQMQILREGADPEIYRLLPPPATQKPEDFTGSFHSEELDASWTFAVEGGQLTSRVLNDAPIAYTQIKPDWFLADNGIVVRFERESGKMKRAFVQAGRVTNLMFGRR
jgi:hypothetical protein